MSSSSVRTILPLSIITCTSMLAMDLYLPAVPTLQNSLGIDVTLAQATVAVFLAGLAASQLLWAEVLTRLGPRSCVQMGVLLLVLGSVGCALAPNISVLLGMRLLQGLGAGVATVVAPSVVRATLSAVDAVRGFAAISMVESVVPDAGPVIGAALLLRTDWRGPFWVLSAMTLPFVVRITPSELPGLDRAVDASYGRIVSNRRYRQLSLSHALCVGALLTFVASAPQLMVNALGLGAPAFATLQVVGVAAFCHGKSVQSHQPPYRASPCGSTRRLHPSAVVRCATAFRADRGTVFLRCGGFLGRFLRRARDPRPVGI